DNPDSELRVGSYGSGDGQFWYPESVTVDSLGNVYVTDFYNHRIQKFTSDGVFITKWGSYGSGDGQFNNPSGVAVDSSGNVYVTELGNNRIQKFVYPDNDNDGYTSSVDCNDNNPAVNPGATEIVNNGIDDDCNPATPVATASGNGYNYPEPLFRASMSLNVISSSLGTSWLKYYYTKLRLNLVSTSITGVTASGGTATVTGVGTVNSVPGCLFTATVTDNSPDAMGIVIVPGGACTTSYSAQSQSISSGNFIVIGQ
ncbi:MAG: hypothetical protein HZA10_04635, partial [Nitrospirae bacterium]|nr:hypothetical protein [Nitrospirota bacterium]